MSLKCYYNNDYIGKGVSEGIHSTSLELKKNLKTIVDYNEIDIVYNSIFEFQTTKPKNQIEYITILDNKFKEKCKLYEIGEKNSVIIPNNIQKFGKNYGFGLTIHNHKKNCLPSKNDILNGIDYKTKYTIITCEHELSILRNNETKSLLLDKNYCKHKKQQIEKIYDIFYNTLNSNYDKSNEYKSFINTNKQLTFLPSRYHQQKHRDKQKYILKNLNENFEILNKNLLKENIQIINIPIIY